MRMTDWPAAERPREKLLSIGPSALSDAELLAIFLRTGTRGRTAVELACELLRQFGSLRGLLQADRQQLCAARGLGPAKFAQLQAALELARRHLGEHLRRGDLLLNPEATRRYLITTLGDLAHEVFCCLFLDTRHRLICYEELFQGTIDGASVHPREVVRRALHHNAAAVILAHNHPSGSVEPSDADQRITRHLTQALQLVDIRVLDHFIIGDRTAMSFAERGLL